jgi:chromosomal replication initiator protein
MTLPYRHDDLLTDLASTNAPPGLVAQPDIPQTSTAPVHSLASLDDALRDAVGDTNYQHWFYRRTRMEVHGDRLLLFVPNPFVLNWVLRRFRPVLNRAAQTLLGPSAACQLEVDLSLATRAELTVGAAESAPIAESAPPGATSDFLLRQLVEADGSSATTTTPVRNPPQSGRRGQTSPTPPLADPASGLSLPSHRRRFRTLESFVAGSCNELAVLAARQTIESPGERFNPLFIHGGTGTGKTHLLEAIWSGIRRQHPARNVLYLTSEGFTNYFTSALSTRTVPGFRQRFRSVDVLLIDNVEFLDNKRATQEEFLHTITQLIEHGGQVVVTSDRHPRMLTRLREELTTRFQSGLVCKVESPDEATRRRLLQTWCAGSKVSVCSETLEYLVRRCHRNIRELQGALNQLEGHTALTGRKITPLVAREILGELADECRRLVRISDVERVVCEAFGVTASDLRSSSRRKTVALPRAIAMFMSRRLTHAAYREIGSYFGGRDHSTVVAAERKVAGWVSSGESVRLPTSCTGRTIAELIDELEQRLQAIAV